MTITELDPIVGWEAITPTHHHSPAMAHAIEKVEIAWHRYDEAVDRWLDGKATTAELEELLSEAQAADIYQHRVYQDENECTCTPDSDACPVCRKYLETNDIPY